MRYEDFRLFPSTWRMVYTLAVCKNRTRFRESPSAVDGKSLLVFMENKISVYKQWVSQSVI